jgi:7-cyano-7-deazaguanine synthase in queuosine biosynthesis
MNQNPPLEVTNTFVDKNGSVVGGPTDDRKSIKPQWSEFPQIKIFNPIINLNKKGIADLCKKFNLTETLFPITRSCEGLSPIETNNYTEHCGECWWCHERKWGFGKLV